MLRLFTTIAFLILATACQPTLTQVTDATPRTYPNYLVDLLIENCMNSRKPGMSAVYSFSRAEVGYCVHGFASVEDLTKASLSRCQSALPSQLKGRVACVPLVENERVLQPGMLARHRSDIRSPVQVEVFDHVSGQTSKLTGYLTTGRYIRKFTREIKLTRRNGAEICRGYLLETAASVTYTGRCGEFEFSGRAPQEEAAFLFEGRFVAVINTTLRKGASFINITTDVPRNADLIRF